MSAVAYAVTALWLALTRPVMPTTDAEYADAYWIADTVQALEVAYAVEATR